MEIGSFEFGEFYLDARERMLFRDGKPIALTPKTIQLLFVLVKNHGRIVEKDVLMREVWADSFVEQSNLTFTISVLRKALNENKESRFIETVSKRGYRFVAEVRETFETNGSNSEILLTSPETTHKNGVPHWRSRSVAISIALTLIVLLAGIIGASWYTSIKEPSSRMPILSRPFSLNKISTNGGTRSAAISPDGSLAVYSIEVDGRQSLWLKQLGPLGENIQITPPSDDEYKEILFSPDGAFIYFARKPRANATERDIYRMPVFGGVPNRIVSSAVGYLALSPDGEKISFSRCSNLAHDYCSMWIADAHDGQNEKKVVTRPSPIRIGDSSFSIDGKRIVFAAGQSENASNEFGLWEIDLETGNEREFTTEKFFDIRSLDWLPDNSGVLLTAARTPNKNYRIWLIQASTGRAKPLPKDSESYATLSIDRSASAIVATQVKEDFHLRLYSMEDPAASRRELTNAFTATFAPNGAIIFSSPTSGNDEIWSMNPDGSGQRQLTNDSADKAMPVVSHDGNWIFFHSNRAGDMQVWRMNFDGSNQVQITDANGGIPMSVSPDDKWLYYLHARSRALWRVSTAGGSGELFLNKFKNRFAFSPDGSAVAFGEIIGQQKYVIAMNPATGAEIRRYKFPNSINRLVEITWLPDGKSIAYVLSDNKFRQYTVWLQHLDGDQTPKQIIVLGDTELTAFAVAPDGRSFLVVQGDWKFDAVLIDGLN